MRVLIAAAVLASLTIPAHADLAISKKPTRNVSCSGGTCTATAANAVLNAGDLQAMLASGDVAVLSGNAAKNIAIDQALTWSSTRRLALDAVQSISVTKPLVVAGAGVLTLTTGAGGDFSFSGSGHVEFQNQSGGLVINGNSYVLESSVHELATAIDQNLGGFFALAQSYDASKDGTYTNAPLPSTFGTFEGLGNTIAGLSVRAGSASTQIGLFSCGCPGSTLRDVVIAHASIQGADNADVVGILAGVSYGIVKGVRVSGSVRGGAAGTNDTIGGLLGLSHGTVSHSHSSAKVSNGAVMGGLVGDLEPAGSSAPVVVDSSATGDIVGRSGAIAGGLIGTSGLTNASEIIEATFAAGSVSVPHCKACGGLVGRNVGSMDNSYSTGAVTARRCSACGGLTGVNTGTITVSYSTGALVISGGLTGGLVGKDSSAPGQLQHTYWDMDTSGVGDPSQGAGNVANDPGITGLSDEQLKSGLPSGFNGDAWAQSPRINNGYPYLRAIPPM